jgi:hypothetical protein
MPAVKVVFLTVNTEELGIKSSAELVGGTPSGCGSCLSSPPSPANPVDDSLSPLAVLPVVGDASKL